MGLRTNNAGSLVSGANNAAGNKIKVRFLEGTFCESVERDVEVGEVISCTPRDAQFFLAYGYAERVEANQPAK